MKLEGKARSFFLPCTNFVCLLIYSVSVETWNRLLYHSGKRFLSSYVGLNGIFKDYKNNRLTETRDEPKQREGEEGSMTIAV